MGPFVKPVFGVLLFICCVNVLNYADAVSRQSFRRKFCSDPFRGGFVRMPCQRMLLSLDKWKAEIQDQLVYQMYFGTDQDRSTVALNPAWTYTINADGNMTFTLDAERANGTCIDESAFGSPEYEVFSSKAEFRSGMQYYAFFSTVPEVYHWNLLCFNFDPNKRRCPADSLIISLFVNNINPDNLPLQFVAMDLLKATCLTLDADPSILSFYHVLGPTDCPFKK